MYDRITGKLLWGSCHFIIVKRIMSIWHTLPHELKIIKINTGVAKM